MGRTDASDNTSWFRGISYSNHVNTGRQALSANREPSEVAKLCADMAELCNLVLEEEYFLWTQSRLFVRCRRIRWLRLKKIKLNQNENP